MQASRKRQLSDKCRAAIGAFLAGRWESPLILWCVGWMMVELIEVWSDTGRSKVRSKYR